MSKPTHPGSYQKRRSPKKGTRPVVGPGKEPTLPTAADMFWRRRWLLLGGLVLLAGLIVGLVLGLGGSSTPPTTTGSTTTTLPGQTTTTAPTTGSTAPTTSSTVPATTTSST